jgi:hypothetical protein
MSEKVQSTFEMRGRTYTEMEDGTIYCDRRACPGSTGLRCQRTEVPICMQCAVRTPVGYISEDAAKEQADKFFNITGSDYVIAGIVAFLATFFSGFMFTAIFGNFGFFFVILLLVFIGGGIGTSIGEIVMRSIKNKRGRYTQRVVGGAMAAATLTLFLLSGFSLVALGYGFITTSAAVSRFEISLRA